MNNGGIQNIWNSAEHVPLLFLLTDRYIWTVPATNVMTYAYSSEYKNLTRVDIFSIQMLTEHIQVLINLLSYLNSRLFAKHRNSSTSSKNCANRTHSNWTRYHRQHQRPLCRVPTAFTACRSHTIRARCRRRQQRPRWPPWPSTIRRRRPPRPSRRRPLAAVSIREIEWVCKIGQVIDREREPQRVSDRTPTGFGNPDWR